jgi:hypothetical protein
MRRTVEQRGCRVLSRRDCTNVSRRDDRTQPGVLTPGYRCKKRPALPVRRSSGNVGRRRKGAEDRGGRIELILCRRRISDLHHRRMTFQEEFGTLLKKTAWHSMNDMCGTDSLAAPSGQIAIGNGYQGLKPLAESCHPFGISPTRPSIQTDTFVHSFAPTFPDNYLTATRLTRMCATNSKS